MMLGFLVLVASSIGASFLWKKLPRWSRDAATFGVFTTFVICSLILGLTFAIPMTCVKTHYVASVRLALPDKNVADVEWTTVHLWSWDPRVDARHNKWVSLADWQQSAGMKVQPITDNPKVRNLEYRVSWEYPTETDLEGWTTLLTELKGETPQTYMSRQLYEFDEKHSRELAKFYNPLDGYQQTEFRDLLMKFMWPTLQKSNLRIVEATFSL
ncbi:MAG: hypothetical protein V1846_02700 [Candidatus Komeilibacteria bacterium]